jgi:hypothetical protein
MKYLAVTAAALFLLATPGAFAQNSDSNRGGQECPSPAVGQSFDRSSAACQTEIDIWIDRHREQNRDYRYERWSGRDLDLPGMRCGTQYADPACPENLGNY